MPIPCIAMLESLTVEPGAIVIVFALPGAMEKIEKLFLRKRSRTTRILSGT